MLNLYKFNCDQVGYIDYYESDSDMNILTENVYNIVLLNKRCV